MIAQRLVTNPLSALFAVALITAFSAPRSVEVNLDASATEFVSRNGTLFRSGSAFTGRTIERYANGSPKREARYHQGKLDGDSRGWFASGQLEYSRPYSSGLEQGVHRGWYENGTRRFEYHFTDGVAHGLSVQWYSNGRKYTQFQFDKGYEAGQQQMWNPDGTLRANYVIKDGRRFGLPGSVGCRGES